MKAKLSQKNFQKAQQFIPGGVNSPVRAFKAVEMDPLYICRGEGSKIYDADGNVYIDYVAAFGPLIMGHVNPEVLAQVEKSIKQGFAFGSPTQLETQLAQQICSRIASIQMIRMVNSGTEATMSAIRLARAYTGRNLIIKCDGHYHGHCDSLLAKAGSGPTTLGLPDSPGVPEAFTQNTITIPFNDIKAAETVFDCYSDDIAAIILEPVPGNMGVVLPRPGFLQKLHLITQQNKALLIFDEVMSGFRVAPGGAQALFKIEPDLTCLGKIIGGGFPVGAYGGKKEIMEMVAPCGPVYQAGTLSGNPVAMTAGLATLQLLQQEDIYTQLEKKTAYLKEGLLNAARKNGFQVTCNSIGSMFTLFFSEKEITNYQDVLKCDRNLFGRYFRGMIERGIYLPPSQFEAAFISAAHSDKDIERTIDAAKEVLAEL